MAVTRLIPMHVNKGKSIGKCLKDRTEYAKNDEKTENGEYISSYACQPETVDKEFLFSKSEYARITGRQQKNDVIAYQLRQSFKPGEISPQEANQIGYETAMSLTKGKHAFIVATHTDRAHIHNHIIFNSTNLDCDGKFRNFFLSSFAIQKISDELCLQHGMSVIKANKPRDFDLLINIQKKLAQGKGQGYANWAKKYNVKQVAKSLLFLQERGIRDYKTLVEKAETATARYNELTQTIRSAEKRLDEISNLRGHIINYSKTRDTYVAYRKSGYSKKFYEAHRQELTLHKAAKDAFGKLEGKVPSMATLNEEFEKQLAIKRQAYQEYGQAKQDRKDYMIAKQNIDTILKADFAQDEKRRETTRSQSR